MRLLEEQTGLSRGAIFHHFADKDALFLAVADADLVVIEQTVAEHGLVQVMRDLICQPDTDWLGTQLEISRRRRTDPAFRTLWASRAAAVSAATRARLNRQHALGLLRTDLSIDVLAQYLELVFEGLIASLAIGHSVDDYSAVLDVVEGAVRA